MSLHPLLTTLISRELDENTFDPALVEPGLVGVFFWGNQCPNCEVAKHILYESREAVASLGIRWYHVNVYEHMDLGVRFGLHGIPTFLFFRDGKKLGRISPFPGLEPFLQALQNLV